MFEVKSHRGWQLFLCQVEDDNGLQADESQVNFKSRLYQLGKCGLSLLETLSEGC